ncbi:MAG: hypothetical protein E6K76_01210 [Candidatus Eisenbacteria bacterium]|uniref:DUF2231 domain-containing protein n=1 Tax=Eiseniibacteriota bacterium TaxID=2212470 RepID=A0A538TAS7_UNCEI|nr:MAG: hypothetical protein E6K76_01210 [Candidatus Eisenbacteria bacterium]
MTGAVAELVYLLIRRPWVKWFGPTLLTLALAGSGVAYFSGQAVHDKAVDQGVPQAAVEKHQTSCVWALGALGLATILSWAVRPRGTGIWLSALVAIAAAALTLYAGYLGGELVYVHGAGRVKAGAVNPSAGHSHTHAVSKGARR